MHFLCHNSRHTYINIYVHSLSSHWMALVRVTWNNVSVYPQYTVISFSGCVCVCEVSCSCPCAVRSGLISRSDQGSCTGNWSRSGARHCLTTSRPDNNSNTNTTEREKEKRLDITQISLHCIIRLHYRRTQIGLYDFL